MATTSVPATLVTLLHPQSDVKAIQYILIILKIKVLQTILKNLLQVLQAIHIYFDLIKKLKNPGVARSHRLLEKSLRLSSCERIVVLLVLTSGEARERQNNQYSLLLEKCMKIQF